MEATPETVTGLIAGTGDRAEAVAPVFEAVGGTLEQYYVEVGGTSSYLVVTVPDQESLAAVNSAVFSSGALKSIQTIPVITSKEAIGVFKKAGSVAYQPPSK